MLVHADTYRQFYAKWYPRWMLIGDCIQCGKAMGLEKWLNRGKFYRSGRWFIHHKLYTLSFKHLPFLIIAGAQTRLTHEYARLYHLCGMSISYRYNWRTRRNKGKKKYANGLFTACLFAINYEICCILRHLFMQQTRVWIEFSKKRQWKKIRNWNFDWNAKNKRMACETDFKHNNTKCYRKMML